MSESTAAVGTRWISTSEAAIKPNADPIQRVLANLAKRAAAKPRTVKTLRSSIKNLLGAGSSEEAVNKLVGELERLNAIKITDGKVTYLTEGCLRFLHRATTGPAEPTRLGVPRSFARADRLAVEPGQDLDVAVELLPVAALLRAGHKIQVALGGHDGACFDRYGPPDETFTVQLGDHSALDLPILASGSISKATPQA